MKEYSGDNLLFDGMGDMTIESLSIATWVKQEKFKGRQSFWNWADNIGGVASPFCGWGYNERYYIMEDDGLGGITKRRPTMTEAAMLADSPEDLEKLKRAPFFYLGHSDLVDNLILDDNGTYVLQIVSQSGLTGYYTHNQQAQELVKVRDWLLAEAFPATTLPMGANPNKEIDDPKEIDMSRELKTDINRWPREERHLGEKVWRHSDYKDVPYQYTYEFYYMTEEILMK